MFKAVQSTVKSRIITVTSLCLVVLLMGIFFASQSYSAAMDAVSIKKPVQQENVWDLKISSEYFRENEEAVPSKYHRLLSNVAIVDLSLTNPEDYVEYTIMLENNGNVDALLTNVNILGLNENVVHTIKINNDEYDRNGETILKANTKSYVTIRVEYRDPTNQVAPQNLRLITSFDYKQKEDI